MGELPYKEVIPRCSGWKRRHLGDDPLILIFTPCWPEKEACGHNHCSLLKEGYDEGSCTPSPGRPLGFLQKFMCLPHCFYPTSQLMRAGKGSVLCCKCHANVPDPGQGTEEKTPPMLARDTHEDRSVVKPKSDHDFLAQSALWFFFHLSKVPSPSLQGPRAWRAVLQSDLGVIPDL